MNNRYLINISKGWQYICKRAVGPGASVPLSELYEQYGSKHNLPEDGFEEWLRKVKIQDKDFIIE